MSKQPQNPDIPQRGPTLHQGAHPTPDPVRGDIWIDNFDTTHVWQGYYWVKVQGGNIEVPTQSIPVLLGTYETHRVYYGGAPPPHAPNTYWITNTREIYDSEVFESVVKKINPSLGTPVFPTSIWEKVYATHIISSLRGFVAASSLLEIPPEVNLAPEKCDEAEAAEKFKAFEEAVDLTGRLDAEGQKQMQELLKHEKDFFMSLDKLKNWISKEPDYKVIPPRDPGLIAQIDNAATYENLTPAALEEFVKTLYHKP